MFSMWGLFHGAEGEYLSHLFDHIWQTSLKLKESGICPGEWEASMRAPEQAESGLVCQSMQPDQAS